MEDRSIYLKTSGRRWCFVWNNYTESNVEVLKNLQADKFDYLIFGFEIGENGTKHLQGYIEFDNSYKGSTVKSRLDPVNKGKSKVSVEPARCRLAAIEYCRKAETKDPERDPQVIEICHKAKEQGKRNDWHDIRDMIKEGANYLEIANVFPSQAGRYFAGIEKMIAAQQAHDNQIKAKEQFADAPLRPWQQKLIEFINYDLQGDRKITWYVDPEGGAGKSWMKRYLVSTMNAIAFGNNRMCDIAHAWNGEPLVIFDFTRETEERINYSAIEDIKNGYLFSPKYNSVAKNYKSPTVICFSNFQPRQSAFSQDRWDIRSMNDENTEQVSTEDLNNLVENVDDSHTVNVQQVEFANNVPKYEKFVLKNETSTKVDSPSRNTIPAGWRRTKPTEGPSMEILKLHFGDWDNNKDNIGAPGDLDALG